MYRRLLFLLMAVVLPTALMTACVAATPEVITEEPTVVEEEPPVVEEEPTVVEEETAAPELQVLGIAFDTEIHHLDPTAPPSGHEEYLHRMTVGESLAQYGFDEKLEVIPWLAESWNWIDDTTLAFTLRQGVQFHNGKELTTEDVKYTYERILDEELGSRFRSYLTAIEEIVVVDDYHGEFKLAYPYAPFERLALHIPFIVPEGSGDEMQTNPIGTGPFKFQEYVKGEKIIYVRNEDYWQAGKPILDQVEIHFQPEYQSRLAALLAGDVDLLFQVDPADVPKLEQEEGVDITANQLLGTFYVGFNHSRSPFNDVNFRQAVRYALDKDLILEAGQAGLGVTKDIQEPFQSEFYTEDFNYERDLDKAREYLEKSGYDGEELELSVPDDPREGPIGETVAFCLEEVGINVKVYRPPLAEYIDKVFVREDFDFMNCGYGNYPDPDFYHYAYFHSEGSNNWFSYSNPVVDQLLDEGRTTLDLDKRKEIYYELFRILSVEDVVVVSMAQSYRPMAIRTYVHGYIWNPLIHADLRNVWIEK